MINIYDKFNFINQVNLTLGYSRLFISLHVSLRSHAVLEEESIVTSIFIVKTP